MVSVLCVWRGGEDGKIFFLWWRIYNILGMVEEINLELSGSVWEANRP